MFIFGKLIKKKKLDIVSQKLGFRAAFTGNSC